MRIFLIFQTKNKTLKQKTSKKLFNLELKIFDLNNNNFFTREFLNNNFDVLASHM